MKLCHQCQVENPDEANFCQACGAVLTPEEETPVPAAEEATQTAEPVAEDAPAAEAPAEDAPVTPETEAVAEAPKKKSSLPALIVILVIVAVAIAAIFGISRSQKDQTADEPSLEAPADEPAGDEAETAQVAAHHTNAYGLPSYSIHYEQNEDGTFAYTYLDENGQSVSVSQEELDALMAQQVASCGELTMNNSMMMFYYDDQWYSFSSTYSSYLSFMMDTTQALDEQLGMDGTNTWEALFVDSGIQMFHQIAAITNYARSEGFTLSEDQQETLDALEAELDSTAVSYGFSNAEAYLQAYFGPAATMENYLEYFTLNNYVNAFLTQVQSGITNTDEELEAYYEENAETLLTSYGIEKIDKPVISVRHILITPESTTNEDGTTSISDEAWAAAEAEAQEIFDQWQSTDPTEDYFAGLATLHTDDPGSRENGGLYEDVYPGQMVTEFNEWCFADGRVAGDTAIVKTSYGYHLMYFVGEGDYVYWKMAASDMLTSQKMSDYIKNLQASQPLTADQSAVVLLNSIAPTVPAAETEDTAE